MSAANGSNGRQPTATFQPEKLRIAAEYRFANPGVAWDEIAAYMQINPSTLWRWRKSEAWEIVTREVASRYVADLAPDALAALRKAWRAGNPAGAIDVLRSFGFLRAAELDVKHSVSPDEVTDAIERILERRRAS